MRCLRWNEMRTLDETPWHCRLPSPVAFRTPALLLFLTAYDICARCCCRLSLLCG